MEKTEIFWVSRDIVIPYKKETHSKKIRNFLYWNVTPAIIIAGNEPESHKALANMFFNKSNDNDNIEKAFYKRPNGAGKIIKAWGEEKITWESVGFSIKTPREIQIIIKDLLGI